MDRPARAILGWGCGTSLVAANQVDKAVTTPPATNPGPVPGWFIASAKAARRDLTVD